jgi:hypothetical protein
MHTPTQNIQNIKLMQSLANVYGSHGCYNDVYYAAQLVVGIHITIPNLFSFCNIWGNFCFFIWVIFLLYNSMYYVQKYFNLAPKGLDRHQIITYSRLSNSTYNDLVGWDSSVCIATWYGLDGPGIKSRWGPYFLHPSRPALGPLSLLYNGY